MAGWMDGWMDWLTDWLANWLADGVTDWLTDWWTDEQTDLWWIDERADEPEDGTDCGRAYWTDCSTSDSVTNWRMRGLINWWVDEGADSQDDQLTKQTEWRINKRLQGRKA